MRNSGARLGESSERPAEERLEPRRIVEAVGANGRAVRVDVIAEHGCEIAAPLETEGVHRGCDRHHAARRDPGSVAVLRHRGWAKLRRRPLVVEPVGTLRGDELLAVAGWLVVLRLQVVEIVAVVAEHEDPYLLGRRGRCIRLRRNRSLRLSASCSEEQGNPQTAAAARVPASVAACTGRNPAAFRKQSGYCLHMPQEPGSRPPCCSRRGAGRGRGAASVPDAWANGPPG